MISSVSSQAGIIASRRKKINETGFDNYRYVKVEADSPSEFTISAPASWAAFTARHIYQYDKTNNSFTFLGVQKAQSLKRVKTWINELTISGFTDTNINGTYTRNYPNQIFYKNGDTNSLYYLDGTFLTENNNVIGDIYLDAYGGSSLIVYDLEVYPHDGTPLSVNILYDNAWINNISLNNINNARIYYNTDPDFDRTQFTPEINFNIYDIFSEKNLVHNQRVFLDIRWINFVDGKRKWQIQDEEGDVIGNWFADEVGSITMNNPKGHIYRAGIIIKDNIIDSMLYFDDLVDNNDMIRGHKTNI